jgi:predicted alpha/beta superfamily hydrolase
VTKVLLAAVILAAAVAAQDRATAPVPLAIGETFTIASKALAEDRRINVYLPPGYTDSPHVRFPVLYMPDGGLGEDFLHVAGLVQVSVGNGTMRPFLLVGIENTERRRDMTGPTRHPEDRKIAPRVGGSAAFRAFIRTELVPAIAQRYRAAAERAIVGESLAGLFVVETLFADPELFDTYIAFDPSLWWNGRELVESAPRRLADGRLKGKVLYLASSADRELAEPTAEFAERLRQHAPAGLRWHHVPMPHETHATIYHPAALAAFRALFKPAAALR